MPFGVGKFDNSSKLKFDTNFSKNIDGSGAFSITESGGRSYKNSEIRFYNTDSLWSRWRRGYELYSLTQSLLGSTAGERQRRGDYRLYFTFQQFPGVFIPARLFTFPSTNQELGEQMVGMRDTDAFSFYDYGLPILGVRYLGKSVSATYSQSGTTLVVTKLDHGLYPGESVWLDISTGGGVDETLSIVSTTQNTFTVTTSASATNNGNVNYYLSTTFGDSRWTTTRTRLRYLPTELSFFSGERLADRIIEKDPGLASTYSRSGSTVTVVCPSAHGLSTGNKVFVDVASGDVASGRYTITVTSTTQFTVTTITSGTTSGNLTVSRLLRGRDYKNYVGYTVTGLDAATKEIIFQRKDSYGATTADEKTSTVVPAHRGFTIGRYLTTELRWQCSCQDFARRDSYDLYSDLINKKFPRTSVRSTKPGQVLQPDGTLSDERDIPGTFRDLGFVAINNFYELPEYEDTSDTDVQSLMYYQTRWCKHIYAAMFAITHDEGNEPIELAAKYTQTGPNITINVDNHGLEVDTKVELAFTSGNAVSGEYTITSVPDPNSFTVIYPFSESASGYCSVSNLKKHDYVRSWLLEPSDKPIGDGLKQFEKTFGRERERLEGAFELLKLTQQNTPWSGGKNVTGNRNQPQSVADFDPSLIGMTLTDGLKRDTDGNLSRSGKAVNTTNRMITLINKLFNRSPTLLEDIKLGIVDKPVDEYGTDFEAGVVDAGEYLNGTPIELADSNSTIDSSTYNPITDQDVVVDSDLYINV
jgi:hypothetical protein